MSTDSFREGVVAPVSGRSWSDSDVVGDDLSDVVFDSCTFEDVRFVRCTLAGTLFVRCRFDRCRFEGCVLDRTMWMSGRGQGLRIVGSRPSDVVSQCAFVECEFELLDIASRGDRSAFSQGSYASLRFRGAGVEQHAPSFSGLQVDRLDARGAIWRNASALGADLARWDLAGASFERSAFIEASAPEVDLSDARFDQCNFHGSNFEGAVLRFAGGCIFSQCALSRLDARGAFLDKALFESVGCEKALVSGASLGAAMMVRSTLTRCDFSGVRAPGSAWTGTTFIGCDLKRLSAGGSSFRHAVFVDTELEGADFHGCDLHAVEGDLGLARCEGAQETVEWRAHREREFLGKGESDA